MRRVVLAALVLTLGLLIYARAQLPTPAEKAAAAAAAWDAGTYNVLPLDLPYTAQTAGSARVAALDSFFLTCRPTARHQYTGQAAGRDLILLLADGGRVDSVNRVQTPMLYKLWSEGVQVERMYAPDWYQGMDGREFALLSGLTPTAVDNGTAMSWAGRQGTYLPFALGVSLGQAGYVCRSCGRPDRGAAYEALGFPPAAGTLEQTAAALAAGSEPYALYALAEGSGEEALARLWAALDAAGRTEDTVVALVTGGAGALEGRLFLWSGGLGGVQGASPASELDVTPTLLDLLGVDYDGRFLAGRDLLAAEDGQTPVALYGTAYSDWVTAAGSYTAGEDLFLPAEDGPSSEPETERYVRRMCRLVYERYRCARQVMELDYFRVIMGR